jgi:hypothetical protein
VLACVSKNPTAMHAVVDAHETPDSTPPLLVTATPGGFGVLWIVQFLPRQRSASVTGSPSLLALGPTAVQAFGAVHDTAVSPGATVAS